MKKNQITSFFRIKNAYNANAGTYSLVLEKSKGKNRFISDLLSAKSFLLAPSSPEFCSFEWVKAIIYSHGSCPLPLIISPFSGRSNRGQASFAAYRSDHVFLFDVVDDALEIYTVKSADYISNEYIIKKFRRGDFNYEIEVLSLLAK